MIREKIEKHIKDRLITLDNQIYTYGVSLYSKNNMDYINKDIYKNLDDFLFELSSVINDDYIDEERQVEFYISVYLYNEKYNIYEISQTLRLTREQIIEEIKKYD